MAISKRNKRRFEAQQVLIQLEVLAHNVLVWARQWLTPSCPNIARLGIKRLIRDIFQMDGFLIFDQSFDLRHVTLNSADPFAKELSCGLASLHAQEHFAISLGDT